MIKLVLRDIVNLLATNFIQQYDNLISFVENKKTHKIKNTEDWEIHD